MKVLVTGASGFVGRAVVARLKAEGCPCVQVVHRAQTPDDIALDCGATTDWRAALKGCDVVIHLAARAHRMEDNTLDLLDTYRDVNVAGTKQLSEQSVLCGVKRLVFVSSIKVNGERTQPGRPFTVADAPYPAPGDPYGISKYEAEQALRDAATSRLETVIVRPPLIYGPGVKSNLARLIRLIHRGVPLPLGRITNRRSMIGLTNVADLLIACARHPAAAGQTFLAADSEDLSTPELTRRIARAMGRSIRLVSVPVSALNLAGRLLGKSDEIQRLTESLQVDTEHTRRTLGWMPMVEVDKEIRNMVVDAIARN